MKKLLLTGMLTTMILAACVGGGGPASVEGEWRLLSYGSPGPASNQIPAAPDVETSIEFDAKGQMSGNVGCNGFGGEYTVDGDTITFGPVMSTMMFCEGSVGEQERWTLAVFQDAATFIIDGDQITITAPDEFWSITLERK